MVEPRAAETRELPAQGVSGPWGLVSIGILARKLHVEG